VQVLLRVIMPPPHVALRSLQSPKSLQPPSTAQQQMITTQIEFKCSFPIIRRDNAILITFHLICWSQDAEKKKN